MQTQWPWIEKEEIPNVQEGMNGEVRAGLRGWREPDHALGRGLRKEVSRWKPSEFQAEDRLI